MPTRTFKTVAQKTHKSLDDLERYWKRAKSQYEKQISKGKKIKSKWPYIMAITLRQVQRTGFRPHRKLSRRIRLPTRRPKRPPARPRTKSKRAEAFERRIDQALTEGWREALAGAGAAALGAALSFGAGVLSQQRAAKPHITPTSPPTVKPVPSVEVEYDPTEPKQTQQGGHITPHFKWSEFACKDGTAVPPQYRSNVKELARNLEVLRAALGQPIIITSGYRTPEHNAAVGGVPNSTHTKGMAADIRVPGMSPREVAAAIEKLISQGKMTGSTTISAAVGLDGAVGNHSPDNLRITDAYSSGNSSILYSV